QVSRGLFAAGPCRTALDSLAPTATARPSGPVAAHVNLGDVASALVFWNVPIPAMATLLERDGMPAPSDAFGLLRSFAERCPGCPIVRWARPPGEGVFVPLLVAHDVASSGGDDLVVTLSVLPGA